MSPNDWIFAAVTTILLITCVCLLGGYLSRGWLLKDTRWQLSIVRSELATLKRAINTHYENTCQDACWEHDVALWNKLDDLFEMPRRPYPKGSYDSPMAMLAGCLPYCESRFKEKQDELPCCPGG